MKFLRLLAILLLAAAPAYASQNSLVTGTFPTVSPYPGLTLVQNINTSMGVLSSFNSGASAPSYKTTYMPWFNTTPTNPQFSIYDGTNWETLGYLNLSNGQWTTVSDGAPLFAPASTGSANAYVVTYTPAPTAWCAPDTNIPLSPISEHWQRHHKLQRPWRCNTQETGR